MTKDKKIINLTFNEKLGDFLVPFWLRKMLREKLGLLGIKQIPYHLLSYAFYATLVIDLILTAYVLETVFVDLSVLSKIILGIFLYAFFEVILYLLAYFLFKVYLVNISYHRIKEIEKALPDFLTELNLQLRSGIPLYSAMERSLNPEYGYLNKVIKDIVKNIKLGHSTKESLVRVAEKYNSSYLSEAMNLVGKADEEGGNSISLIDRLIDNINTHHHMQDQIISNVSGYIFFISMMALIISPALFSSSYHVLVLIKTMINQIFTAATSDAIRFSLEITVDEGQYQVFTFVATLITAFCSAYLIAIIKEGHVKKSVKSLVIYTALAAGSFWLFHFVLGIMFSRFLSV